MRKVTLLKNAMILTITSLILRTFGIFIRSYMSNKIGAEGMGLYQLIISIYVLATTIVTAGTSTAVIRLIADAMAKRESNANIKKIMKKSIIISLVISFFTMSVFYILASPISIFLLKDERCISSIKILIWALPFMSVSSCVKGFFLAKRKVMMNSFSQLFEQIIRIALIFLFLENYIGDSLEKICMYIILSDIISEAMSCIFVYINYKKEMKGINASKSSGFKLKEFFQIAFPITVNKYITSILRTIENILIPSQLALYTLSREVSLSQFGYLKGMALPLIFFPASFLTALSSLLIPETSEASTLKQKNKIAELVSKTFSFTFICAIVISCIFFIYSNEIGHIFYSTDEIAYYIKWLAPLIPFMYMESAIAGMMQGLNQQRKILKYNIIDSVIRISLILIVLPKAGIKGFIAIMYISNIITSTLNMYRLINVSNVKFDFSKWIFKPFISAMASCIACSIISKYIVISNLVASIIFKVGIISTIYIIILFLFGIIEKDLIENILFRKKMKI